MNKYIYSKYFCPQREIILTAACSRNEISNFMFFNVLNVGFIYLTLIIAATLLVTKIMLKMEGRKH